jgi:hypothetical protein
VTYAAELSALSRESNAVVGSPTKTHAGKTNANDIAKGKLAKSNGDNSPPLPSKPSGIELKTMMTVKISGNHAPATVPIATDFRKARISSF